MLTVIPSTYIEICKFLHFSMAYSIKCVFFSLVGHLLKNGFNFVVYMKIFKLLDRIEVHAKHSHTCMYADILSLCLLPKRIIFLFVFAVCHSQCQCSHNLVLTLIIIAVTRTCIFCFVLFEKEKETITLQWWKAMWHHVLCQ